MKKKHKNEYLKFLCETSPSSFSFDYKHIQYISDILMKVYTGEIKRLIVNLPPRHSKSETITMRFSAFWMENKPDQNVLIAGYNQNIGRRFSRKTRSIMLERTGLSEKHSSIDEWSIPNNSTYYVGSANNAKTGIGFNLIILDDLIKSREEANSSIIRQKLQDFYSEDLYSRLEPSGTIIIVQTRWHEDDVVNYAISKEPDAWTIVNLPSLCEDENNDLLGRKLDEPLWEERFNKKTLYDIRSVLGDYAFNALYQGRPSSKFGDFFNPNEISVKNIPEKIVRKVRSYDIANSEGKGDFTASILLGVDEKDHYWILDVWRAQLGTKERDEKILDTAIKDGNDVAIILPNDPAAGKSMVFYWTKLLAGFNVSFERPTKSKEERATALSVQVNNGNFSMLKDKWNYDLISEMRAFPSSRNDDQVDALSTGFNSLVLYKRKRFVAV
jgi:predicted phage terminase large subunit-like protein